MSLEINNIVDLLLILYNSRKGEDCFTKVIDAISFKPLFNKEKKDKSIFIDSIKKNICQSLSVILNRDSTIKYIELFGIPTTEGLFDFFKQKLKFQTILDQTSRDNIYLIIFYPYKENCIDYIELIAVEEMNPFTLDFSLVESIRIYKKE